MLNIIWLGMILISLVCGILTGHMTEVVKAATDSAKLAVEIVIGLIGVMAFWLGMMNIATASSLIDKIATLLKPVMVRLFPEVPAHHPAMGAMVMNMAANMLGIGNAATPFGLSAMKELQTLNEYPEVATNAMCTFLAINTSSVQLIPATAIAFLAANGATHPTKVIITSLIATSISTLVAIIAVKILAKRPRFSLERAK